MPRFADLMCGPNAPLGKALIWCGWEGVMIDWILDPADDLADGAAQMRIAEQIRHVDFLAAALWSARLNPECARSLSQGARRVQHHYVLRNSLAVSEASPTRITGVWRGTTSHPTLS